jgi:DNA-binding transcriptional regulator YiaG
MPKDIKELPPFCLICNVEGNPEEIWVTESREVDQTFRKEDYKIITEACYCKTCGFALLTDTQADKLCRLTADAYRLKHSLLTGDDIRRRREAMKLFTEEFAQYLGCTDRDIRGWETLRVQSEEMDRIIRNKTDYLFKSIL